MENDNERMSIYRVSRIIKRRENTLFNALRSIYEDSIFVSEISELWPQLPLVANLRCGFWYSSNFNSTCYFKSTDGHYNNWSFSTSRLNLHIALLAGQKGGCIIVDSTRKGKRFPDSMSKTIPIWLCLLNRTLCIIKNRESLLTCDWDCSLHLPPWISKTEKGAIEHLLDGWLKQFEASGADIASIALLLRKPFRPLWISQRSLIWLNEVPDYDSWDFTPIILVSASCSNDIVQHRTTSEFSWSYIPGAGDDEESWARGLTPTLFWKHAIDVINFGPGLCNQRVADIVEMDRVCRAYRGQNGSQVSARSSKCVNCKPSMNLGFTSLKGDVQLLYDEEHPISWLGSTNLAVGKTQNAASMKNIDSVVNCNLELVADCFSNAETYLHIPIMSSKFDRLSLLNNLPAALEFAKLNLSKGRSLLVCCDNGEDICVCVCLAIFTSLFNDEGSFDYGKSFEEKSCITKCDIRRRLVFICKYAVNARPCKGNLKQVFSFLCGGIHHHFPLAT